ncbi:hypothetical protein PR202_gb29040 [Eleusine coracana subsp. coracana]|uniref:SAC domain-containing protein n=1 Tax=Eleusine coracana subsp. coracana TaxID=191504 RepID=A0AAV5FYW6_ELECO|nr:hypothetical protein PR202_gb29040 [Eleusine coracana subsp. coracana]
MITIPHSSVQTDVATSKSELRYKKLLASVDLTKDFFYSYTYPIMQSLQQNVTSSEMKEMPYENLFVWNTFLTEPIRSRCRNTLWTVALVHGHFKQVKLSIFGREINVVLISRRSRHFAGTRYLKRGVNDHGKVANDVETEQIVFEEEAGSCKGRMSAVVQMRGSIPLFWSQEASRLSPKPDIFGGVAGEALDLIGFYYSGKPKVQKRRTTQLSRTSTARDEGNNLSTCCYSWLPRFSDVPLASKQGQQMSNAVAGDHNEVSEVVVRCGNHDKASVLVNLGKIHSFPRGKNSTHSNLNLTMFFILLDRDGSLDIRASSGDLSRLSSNADALSSTAFQDGRNDSNKQDPLGDTPCYQTGVLRTNCIDCLDRTNVAQYAYGLAALGRQLHAMGLTDVPKIHPDSSIASALMEMYQSMGDALAHQYGGSAAHNTVFTERQGKWKATTQSREFLKSIKRYYSNAYTDGEKQDAINLFLGYFQPQEGKPALWELDTDYYLHVTTAADDLTPAPGNNVFVGSGAASNPGSALSPVPACKEDFSRMKYTSFDKLIERTCSMIRNVRLHSDSDLRPSGGVGTSGMAPDAVEIQLKSPTWLFGQRKHTGTIATARVIPVENPNEGNKEDSNVSLCGELNWLSSSSDSCEEDIFRRYLAFTTADVENGWYGGTLIYDQDENSGAYKHYSELCQGAVMDPFEHDPEKERHYAEVLSVDIDITNDARVEAEMQAALDDYQIIGSDLSIIPHVEHLPRIQVS